MADSTLLQPILLVLLQIFVIVGLSLIITVINKANLRSNRFYLIKILSLAGISHSVFVVLVNVFGQWKTSSTMKIVKMLIFFMVSSRDMSLYITIMISFDRFFAVKYSLLYPIFATKRKLNIILAIIIPYTLLLNFVLMRFTKPIKVKMIHSATKGMMFNFLAFSILTSITLITVGAWTQRIHRNNEIRIRSIPRVLHGTNEEQINILQSLKRSLKDVVVLNYWRVLFLVLNIAFGILGMLSSSSGISRIVILIIGVSSLSNPFIYAFTQRDILNWIKRFFRRGRINGDTNPSPRHPWRTICMTDSDTTPRWWNKVVMMPNIKHWNTEWGKENIFKSNLKINKIKLLKVIKLNCFLW